MLAVGGGVAAQVVGRGHPQRGALLTGSRVPEQELEAAVPGFLNLTERSVRATFTFLAKASAGSRLIFTYVRSDFLVGTNLYGAGQLRERMTGRYDVWKFGLAPQQVDTLLREYGWVEREQSAPPSTRRATSNQPVGRCR